MTASDPHGDDPALSRRSVLTGAAVAALIAAFGADARYASPAHAAVAMLWPDGTKVSPRISSPFGPRGDSTAGAARMHQGTDFVGFARVCAVADGTVTVSGTPAGWSAGGQQVWIQHDGFLTRSLHLSSRAVLTGQTVRAGDQLGVMGATGNASGVHLHLELVVNGSQIDPVPYITSRLAPIPSPSPEDTMTHSISVNGHLYAVGQQYISHHSTLSQAKVTRQVTSASDELHKLTFAQFQDLLDGLGVPRTVIDASGRVLNPQTGAYESNGIWSRDREILAALTALTAKVSR